MSQRSRHDVGNPVMATVPVHSNLPSVWMPDEVSSCVRPKFRRVTGRTFLSVTTPLPKYINLSIIVSTIIHLQIYRRQLIELVQECRNCISPQNRHNSRWFHTGRCEFRPCYFQPKSIAQFPLCRSTRRRRRYLSRTRQRNTHTEINRVKFIEFI